MSLETMKLEWDLFPENVWANLGLLLREANRGWENDKSYGNNYYAYQFLIFFVKSTIEAAECMDFDRFLQANHECVPNPPRIKDDGFYSPEERPAYFDVNEELKDFLRNLSGREKFEMFQKMLKIKVAADDIDVDKHVHAVLQEMYADHFLTKSLEKGNE